MATRSLLVIISLFCNLITCLSLEVSNPLKTSLYDLQTNKTTTQYGPFIVPSKYDDNGMKSFTIVNATKPCDECVVLSMQANLLYPNGTIANANNGMWLHHAVVMNTGRQDTSCPQQYERFFASGNERTAIDLAGASTRKAGYPIEAGDTFLFIAELMNEMEMSRDVVVTIDWIHTTVASSVLDLATPVWLDVTGVCGANGSEISVPDSTSFSFTMGPPWEATISGDVVFIGSHLHDGGVNLEVKQNSETICDGVASYGQTPGYLESMSMNVAHNHDSVDGMVMEHISSISICLHNGKTKRGDTWSVSANYNLTTHPVMEEEDGTLAPVMGIALLYVANRKVNKGS